MRNERATKIKYNDKTLIFQAYSFPFYMSHLVRQSFIADKQSVASKL
jgi:hypothetical protein